MNAMGMCHHNNWANYCPMCAKENTMNARQLKGLGRLGSYSDFAGGMGAECKEGFYDLKIFGVSTGQCVPSLSTLTSGVQSGALSTIATGVATSPATQAAAQNVAAQTFGNKVFSYVKQHPYMTAGIAAVVAGALLFTFSAPFRKSVGA